MNEFSISQMARFSGIKPHTIRVWEQRYGVLKPKRSKGNTRYYDDEQLRRLLNIVSLLESDYKISELAAMPDTKLFKLIRKVQGSMIPTAAKYFVPQFIAAGMEYDEPAFDKLFSHCLLRYGLKKTYTQILCPMLEQVGLLWATDDLPPANEHFISNIVRQKLYVSTDALPPGTQDSFPWVLFLPENEFHDIGLLMANYLLRLSGKKTIYLGANVPFQSLLKAMQKTNPQNLLLFLTHKNAPENIQTYFDELKKGFSGEKIILAGNSKMLNGLNNQKGLIKLGSVEELEAQL